jgi:hypothetical protein
MAQNRLSRRFQKTWRSEQSCTRALLHIGVRKNEREVSFVTCAVKEYSALSVIGLIETKAVLPISLRGNAEVDAGLLTPK